MLRFWKGKGVLSSYSHMGWSEAMDPVVKIEQCVMWAV